MNKNILALSVAAAALASTASAAVSSNIVGYVKLNLKKGYNLVCNPLNNTAAGGNNVGAIFGSIDCSVLRWTGTTFVSTDILAGVGVVGGADFALAPGQSVFVSVENDATVTTVGDAQVGTQSNSLITGNNFVASKIPIAGTATDLGLTPPDGSSVLIWTGTAYSSFDTLGDGIWPVSEPSFTVGQGFIVQSSSPYTWTKTFTVL